MFEPENFSRGPVLDNIVLCKFNKFEISGGGGLDPLQTPNP